MKTPVNDRVKQWRDRQKEKGKKILNIPLNEESINQLDRIKRIMDLNRDLSVMKPTTKGQVIEMAVKSYAIEANKELRKSVIKMTKSYLNDGHNLTDIANRFNERGIPSFTKNGKWHSKSVKKLLDEA
ncbi:recombinase family protein [Thermodesulfobacteriota bacterium]